MTARQVVLAVGLKAYFGCHQTLEWCGQVAAVVGHDPALAGNDPAVRLLVLPSAPLLPLVRSALAGTPIEFGAQDVSVHEAGPHTGEVPAEMLAELGCTVVEVGHAERRAAGEDDRIVAAKAAATWAAGMTPLVCVGEPTQVSPSAAAQYVVAELDASLSLMPSPPSASRTLLVAYEPRWAIGADEPAPIAHVAYVCAALTKRLDRTWRSGRHSVLYGGSAGPGLLKAMGGHVDGLFLGRRAHDPAALKALVAEAGRAVGR